MMADAMSTPTPDDLLSLLSIHRSCAEPQCREDDPTESQQQRRKATINVCDWGQVVTELPLRRNHVVCSMLAASSAIEKYYNSRSSGSAPLNFDDAFILLPMEAAAAKLRDAIQTYSISITGFVEAISNLWVVDAFESDSSANLVHVGTLLARQLIDQLHWDTGLMQAVLKYLSEEMYSDSKDGNGNMRIFASAKSAMLKIDKALWKLAESQALVELELMEGTIADITTLEERGSSHELTIPRPVADSSYIKQCLSEACLRDLILTKDTVDEAVETFSKSSSSNVSSCERHQPNVTALLARGEEGCGKTFLLDSIQRRILDSPNVKLLCPTHQDFAGNTVGSSEDRWIALFSYAQSEMKQGNRVLVLLDDIDSLLSLDDSCDVSFTRHQVGRRCKALFLSMIDLLQSSSHCTQGHIMLVCTARTACEGIAGRFDRIFNLSQMDELRRRQLVVNCLSTGIEHQHARSALANHIVNRMLSLVVKHSAGRTALELSQFCRDAIFSQAVSTPEVINEDEHNASCSLMHTRLKYLDKLMQTKIPRSLRGGSLDGVVDMIVITPEELISRLELTEAGEVSLPLLGADAKRAYQSLMNVVITPLCRSEKISNLLYGGTSSSSECKAIRVGALLSGAAGVGKTSLAYHCASVAAQMSRVTLLDVSCTSLIHKEIGGSERAVHRLFEAVRAAAPCILLLDGIENVAPRRGNDCTTEGTMDRVLSTFLTEMDGINDGVSMSGNVGVIGITYNPDLIDPSLLRPGRLEKTIQLGSPDFESRKELVARNIDGLEFDFTSAGYFDPKNKDDISDYVAMQSAGMSAVETIAICKEASMECLRELDFVVSGSTKPSLKYHHFKAAVDVMNGAGQTQTQIRS